MDKEKFQKHVSKRIKYKGKIQKQLEVIHNNLANEHFYDLQLMDTLYTDLYGFQTDFIKEHDIVTDQMNAKDPDTIDLHKDVDNIEDTISAVRNELAAWKQKTIAVLTNTKVDENTHPDLAMAVSYFTGPNGQEEPETTAGAPKEVPQPWRASADLRLPPPSARLIPDVTSTDPLHLQQPAAGARSKTLHQYPTSQDPPPSAYEQLERENADKDYAIQQLRRQRDVERGTFLQQITSLEKLLEDQRFEKSRRAMSTPSRLFNPRVVQFDDTAVSNVELNDNDRESSRPLSSMLKSVVKNVSSQRTDNVDSMLLPEVNVRNMPTFDYNNECRPTNNRVDPRNIERQTYLHDLSSGRRHNRSDGGSSQSESSMLASYMSQHNCMIQSFLEESRASLVTQQETNDLPKSKLQVFTGDPLTYWTFVKAFDDLVGSTSMRAAKKLNALLSHCAPEVRKLLAGCQLMLADEGYGKARALLRQKFGNPFLISQAWKSKIAGYPRVNSPELLESYAEDLVCCYNTLAEMGHIAEMENSDCLSTVSSKLDNGLRAKWRKLHRSALLRNEAGRFRNLVELVLASADEQNDPVYNNQRLDTLAGGFSAAPIKQKYLEPSSKATKDTRKHKASTYAMYVSDQEEDVNGSEEEFNEQISIMATEVSTLRCAVCSGQHYVSSCPKFEAMPPKERLETARQARLCLLCLNPGHFIGKCNFKWKCQVKGCVFRHHNLLHGSFDLRTSTKPDQSRRYGQPKQEATNLIDLREPTVEVPATREVDICLSAVDVTCDVDLYKTITVRHASLPITPVIVHSGKDQHVTYALLDSGSTATICTQRMIDLLKPLSRGTAALTINTIHGKQTTQGNIYNFDIQGLSGSESLPMFEVVSLQSMPISTNHIAAAGDLQYWPHLKSLPLANVEAQYVDLLIGQDNAHLLKPVRTVDGPGLRDPFAVFTPLGWTIYGLRGGPAAISSKEVSLNFTVLEEEASVTLTLEQQMERMWALDSVPESDKMSAVDRRVVQRWDEEILVVGGYIQLPIPLKRAVPDFPDNKAAVLSRLQSLGRRLKKDKELHTKYTAAMSVNFDKGYAVRATTVPKIGGCWHLTQLPVQHKRKTGVVRPVWNGGFKFKGRSLNEDVHQGPDMTNRIVPVMVNFRLLPVAVMGDVRQMYNQVKVPVEQRDLMRFLYWEDGDPDKEVIDCCLTYHMFGGGWSPSACCYAVRKIIELEGLDPTGEVALTILKAFYVDDCVKSIVDVVTGIALFQEITTVLGKYHFDFAKLVSNKPELLDAFPEEQRASQSVDLDFDGGRVTIQHSLGQRWQPGDDIFCFVCCFLSDPKSRREFLSTLSTLYDPLGLCAPFLIPAKRMLQELTRRGLSWDAQLPKDVVAQWNTWVKDSECITEMRIPRWVQMTDLKNEVWLIYFSDASEVAYGAACYLCTIRDQRIITANLLISRSRLAPMKSQSIPRLELCAALVAAQLDESVQELLDVVPTRTLFWTDSMLVLRYIHSDPSSYKTFIANRISSIQQLTSRLDWRYVPTSVNPADCLSRGVTAKELVSHELWLSGPEFLLLTADQWPDQPDFVSEPKPDEEKKKPKQIYSVHAINSEEKLEVPADGGHQLLKSLWTKISTWDTLIRRVAWLFLSIERFKLAGAKESKQFVSMVDCSLMERAELAVIAAAQDIYLLPAERNKKSFLKMFPRLRNNLLCIGGRLERATLPTEFKQPYILAPGNAVTTLFIQFCHDNVYHAGATRTLMETRKSMWILHGRREVKRVLEKCGICKRFKAPPMTQMMADLPPFRLKPGGRPFLHIGLDYLGPLQIKSGRSLSKRYICVIVCSVTRAIHLEHASELTTSSFLNAFSRFVSRRGKPKHVLSDNGTNFVGAKAELDKETLFWNREGIHAYCADRGIDWRFNPPAASHFGGMWERHNRTIRSLLLCMTSGATLTDESFQTLLCLIEFSLNSRPLTRLNDDPLDPSPLTPNLLLLGDHSEPVRGVFFSTDQLRRTWKQTQWLANVFWKRWLHEYLGELQKRTKWLDRQENLKVGSLILIVQDNLPRHTWPLGLVEKVHVGHDGLVRAADLRTASGRFTRPIVKLVLLEADLDAG